MTPARIATAAALLARVARVAAQEPEIEVVFSFAMGTLTVHGRKYVWLRDDGRARWNGRLPGLVQGTAGLDYSDDATLRRLLEAVAVPAWVTP